MKHVWIPIAVLGFYFGISLVLGLIAEQLASHMEKLVPVSWAALTGVTGG